MAINFDSILEYTVEPCFPQLHKECAICGESLFYINPDCTEACINPDCAYAEIL